MAEPTVRELLTLIEAQQARIDSLEARAAAPGRSMPQVDVAAGEPKISRRGMLMGAAAVGTVGLLGGVLADPEVASASGDSGPASFSSTTTTPAVTADNTGTGSAV